MSLVDKMPSQTSSLLLKRPGGAMLLLATASGLILLAGLDGLLPGWLMRPPAWLVLPLADWFNAGFTFLREDMGLTVVTRAFAALVATLLEVTANVLSGERGGMNLPAVPWTVLAISGFMLGLGLRNWKLGLLAGGTFAWLALFGQWEWAMQTLSLIIVAAPLSVLLGFGFGVLAWRWRWAEAALMPLLNVVQSLPHFAYLIPVVVFFGIGDQAGAIATVIFATPPMIRMTLLGLRKVPPELIESGQMCGATRFQLMQAVRVPTARSELLVGVNQVIMQCLAMVVIASFIGAPGLGYKLLQLLQSLKIGRALEIGVSIVLIAIMLDRLSRAWAELQPAHHPRGTPWWQRHRLALIWAGLIAGAVLVAPLHPWLDQIPRRQAFSTAPFWDALVDWVTVELYHITFAIRSFLSIHVLVPLRDLYLAAPFSAVLALVGALGWHVGGARSAAIAAGFVLFIAISGWWDRAMITAYMITFAVGTAVVIGMPVAIWSAREAKRAQGMLVICDSFQTFPSFIYLIPVIMLFQVNDVSAIAAVVIYATVPVIRYTIEGLRGVPQALREAVDMAGASRRQRLWSLELPLALPQIMIGLNQSVMFALFMVIIAAFIGTQDLGQEMMRALSASDVGKGLVLGLCVASWGLMVDHILMRWARDRQRALGLV